MNPTYSDEVTDWLTGWQTDWLTPRNTIPYENLTVPQPVNKLPIFYVTLRFTTVLTRHRSLIPTLGQINPVQPHPICWTSISKLSSHLSHCLSSVSFPHVLRPKQWWHHYELLLVLLCHQTIRTSGTCIISTAQITPNLLSSNLRTWRYTSWVTCIAITPIFRQIISVHIVTLHISFKVNI